MTIRRRGFDLSSNGHSSRTKISGKCSTGARPISSSFRWALRSSSHPRSWKFALLQTLMNEVEITLLMSLGSLTVWQRQKVCTSSLQYLQWRESSISILIGHVCFQLQKVSLYRWSWHIGWSGAYDIVCEFWSHHQSNLAKEVSQIIRSFRQVLIGWLKSLAVSRRQPSQLARSLR